VKPRNRTAGIPLSLLIGTPAYDDPAGKGEGEDHHASGDGNAPQAGDEGAGGTADAPGSTDPSEGQPSGDVGQEGTDADGKPSRIKELSDEAAKYRTRAKAAEEQLAKLTDQTEQVATLTAAVASLRVELEFQRFALPLVSDLDAARKLADLADVKPDEDGNVVGMAERITSLLRNYPFLEKVPDTQPFAAPGTGGTPVNGRREGQGATTDRAALAKKYPALKGRV
jgi:hypothetical protein